MGNLVEKLQFTSSKPLTLGVEIEVQILDKTTLDLSPKSPLMLAKLSHLGDRIKAEIFQSMLEFNTGICATAHEVHADLLATMNAASAVAESLDLRLASTGTHPFAIYSDRILYPAARYKELIDRNQWIARRLMIFGMHVHIGMRNGEHAIQMSNALLHYLSILLALSTSSPYWHSEETELASSRITFFEALPTGGHPCEVRSWDEFVLLYENLVKADAIRSPKDLWWDVRPSPSFGTVEIRICDGLSTLAETSALVALIHALCIFIDQELSEGRQFDPPSDWILRENKWRASRWGTECRLIVGKSGEHVDLRTIVANLLNRLESICRANAYQKEFHLIEQILDRGTSASRQRRISQIYGGDLRKVTDFNAREFQAKEPLWDFIDNVTDKNMS